MGKYIGVFNKKENSYYNSFFYNFLPLAEIINNEIIELDDDSRAKLLPESQKGDIYFEYNQKNPEYRNKFESIIGNKKLMVFEFETIELLDHTNRFGERNPTGYKVQAIDMIDENKLRPLSSENIYLTIKKDELDSDFSNKTVDISANNILKGDNVLINFGDFFAGPYEVYYRNYSDYGIQSYYIKPSIKETKYISMGYNVDNIRIISVQENLSPYFEGNYDAWNLCMPVNPDDIVFRDEITDEKLIEFFFDSLNDNNKYGGKISIDDISSLINNYQKSALSGKDVPEHICKNRISRLKDILSSENMIAEMLKRTSKYVLDYIIDENNQPAVNEWLNNTLEEKPEIFDALKETKIIKTKLANLEQAKEILQAQVDDLDKEIKEKSENLEERNKVAFEEKSAELIALEEEYKEVQNRIADNKKELDILDETVDLTEKVASLKKEEGFLEEHKRRLKEDTDKLEGNFQKLINESRDKIVDLSFDGYVANKLLQAASDWESEEEIKNHQKIITSINSVSVDDKKPSELIDYLCKNIHTVRPQYSKNEILNIAICLTQGFLTVFSGEPGCGKTSICNIFGDVLGLNKIVDNANLDANEKSIARRYLPVSVERGWTSKRDFVGYYNPLSKSFDKTNRRVYEALHQLSTEKELSINKFPFLVLLDEANLSPMEYYWSDFMNICDDLGPHSEVNLGEKHIFGIPQTLRFVATINNDHTTETLSPRLIDRAWIITLPLQSIDFTSKEINKNDIEIIPWESLADTFVPNDEDRQKFTEVEKIYNIILSKMREQRFFVSPRNSIAIKDYWAVASKVFVEDEAQTEAPIVALDYAVAQKLLPKIIGNGESFMTWLEDFRNTCNSNDLKKSAKILQDILTRGNQNMQYYQFFY